MNKSNIFKSSSFHLDAGDKLYLTFIDETGVTTTINLQSEGAENSVPGKVIVGAATNITSSSFKPSWNFMENSTGYYLYVATDIGFTSMVAGYNGKDVGNVNNYNVTGLSAFTFYYCRIRAYNAVGYGLNSDIIDVQTLVLGGLFDKDGNEYHTVIIGSQEWIVENLRTTKYADGTAIPNITIGVDWGSDIIGAYCSYDNDPDNIPIWGLLYNWYAVDNAHGLVYFERGGVQETGWRAPSQADITVLDNFLGGVNLAGGKLKEAGIDHWDSPNTGATDDYGFKFLGAGNRFDEWGDFAQIRTNGWFWGSDLQGGGATALGFGSGTSVAAEGWDHQESGFSVRCVRDCP